MACGGGWTPLTSDYANSLLYVPHKKISIGSSVSKTHLPESLPVTLSDKTHTQLVFLNIIGLQLSYA